MDTKNTVIGIALMLAAFLLWFKSSEQQKQIRDAQNAAQAQHISEKQAQAQAAQAQSQNLIAENSDDAKEEILILENDNIRAHFTNLGGAIKKIELLKFKKIQEFDDPYVFNDSEDALALGFALNLDAEKKPILFKKSFKAIKVDKEGVIYEFNDGKTKIIRAYTLNAKSEKESHPYLVRTETAIQNVSSEVQAARKVYLSLGMAVPNAGDVDARHLAFGLYDGNSTIFNDASKFVDNNGFLGLFASKAKKTMPIENTKSVWGAVKNQFFAAIFTPSVPGTDGMSIPLLVNKEAEQELMKNGVEGFMGFEIPEMQPSEIKSVEGEYFVGPKELSMLSSLGNDQDLVMDFGWTTFVSKPLLMLLEFLNSLLVKVSPAWSWGFAIIALTVIVRACMWPLTVMQIRSSQRMMKLQEPMAEIRQKYKNDPQKMNMEVMGLYREYGINPMAGCFPALVQLPIFIGLYFMLQSSGGIRFAHFLWINDLSLPDTIPGFETLWGFPVHILPFINAAITYINMHIIPMPNSQPGQKMIMKLLPFIMLFFFYSFPSALVLYWTVQSMIGVLQAIIVIKTKDKVVIKKREPSNKPTFMQKLQKYAELQKQRQEEGLKGTMYEKRKSNPGGRSTPTKRK